MSITAVYPGSFDPITNAHADLARRAARLFDHVIIAIATNPAKTPVISFDERVELARHVLSDLHNVSVMGIDGLLVEFARAQSARVILRGVRAVSDFEFEFQMAAMNRNLAPELETLFLTPAERHTFISSSLVREVASLGGEVADFVAPEVKTALCRALGIR